MEISKMNIDRLIEMQEDEITSYHVYLMLSQIISRKSAENSQLLAHIAEDEMEHYQRWKAYTGKEVRPNKLKVWFFVTVSRLLGMTFGLKLMESGEGEAQVAYGEMVDEIPDIVEVIEDEHRHENELLNMLDEEMLNYVGSVVLGLNDALVELTGALAGLTFAFQNTNLIALTGLITGIAASLSMAASEYLSTSNEESGQNPLRSAIYTGIAYVLTVAILVMPYLIFKSYVVALIMTLVFAILIIAIFNFYISVAKDYDFKKRFLEMAAISLGVAFLSFIIGKLINNLFGIQIP